MTELLAPPVAVAELDMTTTPYVGLVPYEERDAAFFFGRANEKRIVAGNLRATRLTILYGPSGVGKTSLLQAGVVHDLHEQVLAKAATHPERAPFAVCVFRAWRDEPLPALVESIRTAAVEALGGDELPPTHPDVPLVDVLHGWTQRVRTLLVVLDQFEDYFLYHADEDGEGTFAVEFPRIVNDHTLRVHFLVSIREDAWAKLDRFEGRIPGLFANYIRVEHLKRTGARQAIVEPLHEWSRRHPDEARYDAEPDLVDAVISAAAAGRLALAGGDDTAAGATASDAVEAPFLQLVMERLWHATLDAGEHTLTLVRLEQLGGAQRIAETHLLRALGSLTGSDQAVAADLFRYLVTRSKTKIAHTGSDLADWTKRSEVEVGEVLEQLSSDKSGRILRPINPARGLNEATRYELRHDILAEPILEWRRRYEQRRARRATLRRFGAIAGVLAALVAAFAALGVWAVIQKRDADRAKKAEAVLVVKQLASTARAQAKSHLNNSLLLAFEAYRRLQNPDTHSAMLLSLETARQLGLEAIYRTGAIYTLALSPDGHTLATAGADGLVRLRDLSTHRQLGRPLRGHKGAVYALAFSRDGRTLASAGRDSAVLLWDMSSRELLDQLGNPVRGKDSNSVYALAFSPDGNTLASAGSRAISVWDVRTHRQDHLAASSEVDGLAFSPDGHTLASAGDDGIVRLWDARTRRQLATLDRLDTAAYGVAFSPDGRFLAAGGSEGAVRLWNARTLLPLGGPLRGFSGSAWRLAFSPDSHTIAAAGSAGVVHLWTVRTARAARPPLRGDSGGAWSLAFTPDGETLLSAGEEGIVRRWDLQTDRQLGRVFRGGGGAVDRLAVSRDGRTLASAGEDGTIRVWDAATRRQLGDPIRNRGSVYSVAISGDGRTLAAPAGRTIRFWDARTHRQLGEPLRDGGRVYDVVFTPDGRTLAAAGATTVQLWDVRTHRKLGDPIRSGGHTYHVAFSPDGHTLASAGADGVRLWNVSTHEQIGEQLRSPTVYETAFSPDGHTLASTDRDDTVRLWDVGTHRKLHTLQAPSFVDGIAFSSDGLTLAGASGSAVRLWDVATGEQLGQDLQGDGEVYSVAFTSHDGALVSAGDDGIRRWDGILWMSVQDLKTQVCDLVVGNLSRQDWRRLVSAFPYHATC